jgi:hydrogenase expression/formation protein HypC
MEAHMCLAVPVRIIEIEGMRARVEASGVVRDASLMLLPNARVGDYVILHAGFAIEKLDEEEAAQTLELFRQIGEAMNGGS